MALFPRLRRIIDRIRYVKKAVVVGAGGGAVGGGFTPIEFHPDPLWNILFNTLAFAISFGLGTFIPANGPRPQ